MDRSKKGSSPICGNARAPRAMTRLVILRAVAGPPLANDIAAEVDSATARAMTWLDGRPRDDAVASPQTGEDQKKCSSPNCGDGGVWHLLASRRALSGSRDADRDRGKA
jgi:hypothetical protein